MNYCLAQIVLAARGDDAEGWINTLVIVLLVVFWAIGGILKARAKKTKIEDEIEDEEDEYGEEPLKLTAHPSTAKPRGVAVWRPQPQRIRAGAKTLAEEVEPRPAKPTVTVRKAREPKTAVAKVTSEWAKKPVSAPEEPTIEPLLSAEEPDELKKAILHYEILGKPLSLRGPAEY